VLVGLAQLPCASSGTFGAEARDRQPDHELAPTAPVQRGERIQPEPVITTPPNPAPGAARSGPATNQAFVVQDGDFVGFDKLSGFSIPLSEELEYATNAALADAKVNAMIPASLRAADGKTIRVNSYMTPLDYEGGKTKAFLLSRNPSACCFGAMPLIHELIEVRLKGEGVPVFSDVPVQVRGVLRVGAKRNGAILGCIYRIEAESVAEAEQ